MPKILKDLSQESICYLESSINYTLLFLRDGKSIVSGYNIKVFEEIFDKDEFIKINRSRIVNVAFIQKTLTSNRTCTVHLANGERITIARRRLTTLKESHPAIF